MKSKFLLGAVSLMVTVGALTACTGGTSEAPTMPPSATAPASATASANNDMMPGDMGGTNTTETATPSASATAKAE